MEQPRVGSLVVPAPRYRESMQTGEGAALLLEVRRSSGRLFYFDSERGFSVPMRQIQAIPAEAVASGSLERLLSDLLLHLEAEGCVIEDYSGRSAGLTVEVPGLPEERLNSLHERFGSHVASFAIEPGSMHALILKLELTALPASDQAVAPPAPGNPL